MYEYRTLEQTSPVILYETFRTAYEGVPSIGGKNFRTFAQVLQNCGYLGEGSMGAFDKKTGRLVAFALNSVYIYGGSSAAYNIMTGTLPQYRRQGIARELLTRVESLLKDHQVTSYMSEALQTNEAAVALFRSRGFKIIGELSTPVTDDTGSHEISQYTLQLEL